MFACTACTRRCLRAIASDALDARSSPLTTRHVKVATCSRPSRRSTPWLAKSYGSASPADEFLHKEQDYNTGLVTALDQNDAKTQRWQEPFRQTFGEDTKPPAESAKDWETRDTRYRDPARLALQEELRFLKDPLKLAEHTVRLLHKGETEKAYELVKLSSKSLACTVSWNHLMDYEMSKERAANAMRIYNDVCICSLFATGR